MTLDKAAKHKPGCECWRYIPADNECGGAFYMWRQVTWVPWFKFCPICGAPAEGAEALRSATEGAEVLRGKESEESDDI